MGEPCARPFPVAPCGTGDHKGRPYRDVTVHFDVVLRGSRQHTPVIDGISYWYIVGALPLWLP